MSKKKPTPAKPACQLYLISPQDVGGDFPAQLSAALSSAPVAAFQFRVKGLEQHAAAELAAPLQEICAAHEVSFLVNDDVALAKRLGADGVHLGQGDGDPREARIELGPYAQIGVTCHNSRDLAMTAGEAGADYVAFGAFFPSPTKPTKYQAELELLTWWQNLFELPCVAIGGITVDNARSVVAAGADFVAVSSGVWTHPDGPATAVSQFSTLLAETRYVG